MRKAITSFAPFADVIPCGVDIDVFKPTQKSRSQPLAIGFPGNPKRPEKNFSLFIEVVELIRSGGRHVEIMVFDNLTRSEVIDQLNSIDILLLTSTSEGSPQIVKEAIACNTSVVSVPVGDVREVISGIDNCRVSNSYQAENLAALVLDVLNSRNMTQITLGRDRLLSLALDQASVAKRIVNHYLELLT
jgi:glycosyltransferase involved in cell wall biosynthesis